ncbi:hypothetical protein [Deinococcus aquatilis]|uniref:hypothetical protein n=1 Tax=Deinococcus aquatilis TaxID=519440 RepID=UPI0012F74EB0|nr:hypothetical protein [Deinococcus aquatilis]
MPSPLPSRIDSDAPLLRALAGYGLSGTVPHTTQDLGECVRPFLPLLFTLADRAGVADREAVVAAMLKDVQQWCHCWESSGLPARVWVIGVAQRHLQQRQLKRPAEMQQH